MSTSKQASENTAGQVPQQSCAALWAALEHAEKHAARCDAEAQIALSKWVGCERALNWNALTQAQREEKGARLERLWRVYQGERDGAVRAHALVKETAERLAGINPPQLVDVVGERCDKLDKSLEALAVGGPMPTVGRLNGIRESLVFWTAIEVALREGFTFRGPAS